MVQFRWFMKIYHIAKGIIQHLKLFPLPFVVTVYPHVFISAGKELSKRCPSDKLVRHIRIKPILRIWPILAILDHHFKRLVPVNTFHQQRIVTVEVVNVWVHVALGQK